MIRRPPRSTQSRSSAASDVYKRQLQIQDAKNSHLGTIYRTTLSGYIFATKARIDNRKKNLFSSNMSSRCSHNMVNFSPLAAEIVSLVWGTPPNFNFFSRLGSFTARHVVVVVSQTLRRCIEGATYVRQGDHHVGHWPTFQVYCFINLFRVLCIVAADSSFLLSFLITLNQLR